MKFPGFVLEENPISYPSIIGKSSPGKSIEVGNSVLEVYVLIYQCMFI